MCLAVSVLRIGSRDGQKITKMSYAVTALRRGRPASQSAPRVAVGASSLNKTIPDQYCRNLYVVFEAAKLPTVN